MGVPKFFRYISERYPCLSESVKQYQMPEFDNLYLDMNAIIHICLNSNEIDPHLRIPEEKIFQDIFHYIEVLFRIIKPRKVFLLAIDGVAPSAKMNQQRARRFLTANEVEKSELKAKERGEQLPSEERFDTNCITPGTIFMAKLHEQLKYFIIRKITNDKMWNNCNILLSGHDTPGEGEHKIMDYIRYIRAQPGYNPNTRHCLYGQDADLIILGLCTHEPHFTILREEVFFGKQSTKTNSSPDEITFFLLHISLMREYLELEFISVKDTLPFVYDIEKIIDDWVLLSFLLGNDFIPQLPNFHIANNALPILYNTYMKVLPTLDGYMNENGNLHLDRFEKFMEYLNAVDMDHFSEQYADLKYIVAKTGRRPNENKRTSYAPKKMEECLPDDDTNMYISLKPEYKKPIEDMCLARLITKVDALTASRDKEEEFHVKVVESDAEAGGSLNKEAEDLDAEFKLHKRDYYMNKLQYEEVTPEVLREQAECYVRAIQWNLYYYYNSLCSWSWYYPHHYAPFLSDIVNFKNFQFEFELGIPLTAFEQLLAVLPAASKTLLPKVYHELMTSDESSIKDYYPEEFQLDMQGKRYEWEALIILPFMDNTKLLDEMSPCNLLLTEEEIARNTPGPMLSYCYTEHDFGEYKAPEYFPVLTTNHAECTPIYIEDLRVPIDKLVKGAYPGVKMDVYYPGFSTMKFLKYESFLDHAEVKVFEHPSRGESMILVVNNESVESIEDIAKSILGKSVFVGWPHLVEALAVSVSNMNQTYHFSSKGDYTIENNRGNVKHDWELDNAGICELYLNQFGIQVGELKILVHVRKMMGRKYVFTPQGRVNVEKQWATITSAYPIQTVVRDIKVYDQNYTAYREISDVFVEGSQCFMLAQPHYGSMGTVKASKESSAKGRVEVSLQIEEDPNLKGVVAIEQSVKYMDVCTASSRLGIGRSIFTRITGSILVMIGAKTDVVVNIGLNLKFNKKNEEIPGYTKKDQFWLYSQKTLDLVQDYMEFNPKLFYYLNKHPKNDYVDYDIFPEDNGSGETVKEIVAWIRKQPYFSVEHQQCGSLILEPDVVVELEKVIDEYEKDKKSKTLIMQVEPHLLYKPDIQMVNLAPDLTTTYQLYDRVINVGQCYTVPFGYTGTVIAIHNSEPAAGKSDHNLYDILFDKPFAGGLPLNCSSNRGYRLSKIALINKSHGARLMEHKLGKPGLRIQQLSGKNLNHGSQPITSWRQTQQQSHSSTSQTPNYPNYHSQNNSALASLNRSIQQPKQYTQQNCYQPPNPTSTPNHMNPPKVQSIKKSDFMPSFGGTAPSKNCVPVPPNPYYKENKHPDDHKNNAAHCFEQPPPSTSNHRNQPKVQPALAKKIDFMPNFGGSGSSKKCDPVHLDTKEPACTASKHTVA